jgi:hypothetical protein
MYINASTCCSHQFLIKVTNQYYAKINLCWLQLVSFRWLQWATASYTEKCCGLLFIRHLSITWSSAVSFWFPYVNYWIGHFSTELSTPDTKNQKKPQNSISVTLKRKRSGTPTHRMARHTLSGEVTPIWPTSVHIKTISVSNIVQEISD